MEKRGTNLTQPWNLGYLDTMHKLLEPEAHTACVGPRSDMLVLPERGVEQRGALIFRQRFGEVLARSSRLKGIAEPFVRGQRSFERRPSTGRVALPVVQQSRSAIDGRPQHGDRLADAFALGQKRPKFFGIMKGDESVDHEDRLERCLLVCQPS